MLEDVYASSDVNIVMMKKNIIIIFPYIVVHYIIV